MATNVFPYGVEDIDNQFLEYMDDKSLVAACCTNVYLASLSNNELFWEQRTKSKFKLLLRFRHLFSTWKRFYQALINKAVYVVDTAHDRSCRGFYNNIRDIIESELFEIAHIHREYFVIRILFKGLIVACNDREYIIYSSLNYSFGSIEDISLYPQLSFKEENHIIYESLYSTRDWIRLSYMGFEEYSTQGLRFLHSCKPDSRPEAEGVYTIIYLFRYAHVIKLHKNGVGFESRLNIGVQPTNYDISLYDDGTQYNLDGSTLNSGLIKDMVTMFQPQK